MGAREIPHRQPDGTPSLYFVDVEGLDTIEDALERAAQLTRIARLIVSGMMRPESDEDDDVQLLDYVLWAAAECQKRAIELHNATVPGD